MRTGPLSGLLLGAALGLGAGWLAWGQPPPQAPLEQPAARAGEAPEGAAPSLLAAPPRDAARREPAPSGPAAPAQASAPGTAPAASPPAALLDANPTFVAQRRQEIADDIRRRAETMIATAEGVAARQVVEQIEKERAAREDLARGGVMAFLREKAGNDTHFELVSEGRAFGRLFERKASGARIEGATLSPESEIAAGDRIVYPPGQYTLDVRSWQRRPLPADVVIEGHSMDQTLLRLSDALSTRGELHNLTFRDLTLHCSDNYLESIRPGPFTLTLERCRVIGFDMGAGGSCMLGGGCAAFRAVGCRIEAGFGRAPGFGHLFDVRGGLLARLEDCEIVGPFRSVWYAWSGATHVFERCRFREMSPRLRPESEKPPSNVRLLDCTWTFRAPGASEVEREQRSLAELNPAWATPPR